VGLGAFRVDCRQPSVTRPKGQRPVRCGWPVNREELGRKVYRRSLPLYISGLIRISSLYFEGHVETFLHRIGDQKPHQLGRPAVADHAMKAGLVLEALYGEDEFFRIVIERRHYRAFQHVSNARHRMRMTTASAPAGM